MVGSEGLGAHKSTAGSSAQAWGRVTWVLGSEGAPLGLPPPDCQAQQSLPSSTQLGLLMSSVPSTTHWIRFWTNKTNVPSYGFPCMVQKALQNSRATGHCFQVTNPPGEAIRNWAKCSTGWSPSLFVTESGTCLSFYLVVKHLAQKDRQLGLHFE